MLARARLVERRPAGRPWIRCDLTSHLVERLLRETVRTTDWSAAIAAYADHRTPRCIQGAFLAYFLCTSKESELSLIHISEPTRPY